LLFWAEVVCTFGPTHAAEFAAEIVAALGVGPEEPLPFDVDKYGGGGCGEGRC
jgi:hypothetical protein